MLTSGLMKFVLACLTSHHQGTSSAPCRWDLWPAATALPQEICLCMCKSKRVKQRDFVQKGASVYVWCSLVFFLFLFFLFACVFLHVSVSAHLPALAAVCTLGPVFSRAEEEAAEWWHCLPTGTLAMIGARWGAGWGGVIWGGATGQKKDTLLM